MSTASATGNETVLTGLACGLTAALIWGAWPVISRLGVQQTLTAYDITALRFGVAGVILLPIVWRKGAAGLGWGRACVLACGAGVPYALTMVVGLSFAPAAHAGVIGPSSMLVFSTLGAWLALGDRPTAARLTGLAVVLCGVALIGQGSSEGGNGDEWIGHGLFVAGGLCWATYTVASRAWSVDPFHATALVAVLSMAAYLPAYLALGGASLLAAPVAEIALQAVVQGVLAAVLALVFYTRAVAILGAGRGAVFSALVPPIAVLLAAPVLGETPGWPELLGAAAVTAGMIRVLSARRR